VKTENGTASASGTSGASSGGTSAKVDTALVASSLQTWPQDLRFPTALQPNSTTPILHKETRPVPDAALTGDAIRSSFSNISQGIPAYPLVTASNSTYAPAAQFPYTGPLLTQVRGRKPPTAATTTSNATTTASAPMPSFPVIIPS
jgi:hypothetical protein